MRYIFLTVFIVSMIISIRRRNALLRYLQEATLKDYTNKPEEDKSSLITPTYPQTVSPTR